MGDSIISAVAPNIFEICVGAAKEHLGYIWNYKKNMANLQEQVKKLDEERADKSHSVTVAEKDVQKIKNRAKSWLEKAGKTCEETTTIINDYEEKGQNKCLMGLCPNLILRYQLSKRACKKATEIMATVKEAVEIEQVADRTIGLGKEIALSTEVVLSFKSRELVLVDIMKALHDETKNLIGVYGFGGMGKTTLVKQIAKRAEEEKMFEEIVFVPVTQVVELKKVQEKIASMLDLRLSNSNEAESAGLIYGRLKGKKVLVILDDLWEKLDLNGVGIPSGAEHMYCKILFTSRTSRVLSSMGTKADFLLGALEEEEAWRLFEEKTIDVIKDPTLFAIGKKVAKRCAGLPVLIVTTAASLSKRPTVPAWNDALKQLKKMDNKQVHENINSAIKSISYNHLGKKHKKLFLLCGLVGGNVSVEHFMQYIWGLDMFDGEVVTMGEARDRLHTWILDLKEFCLLLNNDNRMDRNFIKMHDVVRDAAISIAEQDLSMFSVECSGAELNISHMVQSCTAIVFHGGPNLSCLPQQLECPSLELCILSRQYEPHEESSFSIPNTFFEKTGNLKVLDMSKLYVSTLPSSLSFLKNLQSFRADYCHRLKDISIVGELKKLQTLSIVASGIEELPGTVGKLVELRLLDLSYCRQLRIIPAGLIAGLSRLEELKMGRSFGRLDLNHRFYNNGLNNSGRTDFSLSELLNLTSLEIEVSNAKLLSKDLSFEKWEKYEIIVGDMWSGWRFWYWLDQLEITRKVCLQLGTTRINHLQHVVEKLLKRTECLCLGELKGVKNVTPELDADGFPHMKHLRIKRDCDIQYIVNVEDRQHKASFPVLESLHLSHLLKLQKISNGRLMERLFSRLKVLKVKNCNRLESLLSFSMAIGLQCLQEIQVSKCDELEGIVAVKNREDDDVCEKIEFEQLLKLSLKCLPELNNFFAGKSLTTNAESEEIVEEETEFKSSMPFFKKVSFPKLEDLELSGISNLAKIWSNKPLGIPCCNLTRLKVENCDNLQYLLTRSVSMVLVGLRILIVDSCVKMKNIVAEEEGETKTETICFPHLIHLSLRRLPNLTTFYSRSEEESHDISLQPLFNEKIQFPSLERLSIDCLDSINSIWPNQKLYQIKDVNITNSAARNQINLKNESHEVLFNLQNVQKVSVYKCKSLKHVFPVYVAQSLNKLEELWVEECEELKTIIGDDNYMQMPEEVVKETELVTTAFVFPKLAKMYLRRLPKVKCFYPREHTSEWPVLETFEVRDCGEISPSDFLTIPAKQRAIPLEKVIWGSVFMIISSQEMIPIMRLYDGHSLQHLFRSLKQLVITEFHGKAATFPSRFLSIIHNQLREFRVYNCSFQEIFPYEGEVIDHVNSDVLLPRLTKLKLKMLPELKYICKEDGYSTFIPVLDKVLFLDVTECPRLTNLVPPSVSFKSIQYLTIKNCGGLVSLIQPSTARSLEHLHILSISGCERMEEIIGRVKDDEEQSSSFGQEIMFNNLTCLKFVDLPRLESFCSSRSYTFNIPELDLVHVEECPNMKTFCGGITTNPKLRSVYLNESRCKKRWEGELNTTIERIYAKREAKRLGITIPSTSSNNHFEAEAQAHQNSADGLRKSTTEGQTRHNAANQEHVTNIVDKGKGKEVVVKEYFEKSQDPSCSNYAAYIAPSQHVGASFSQLIPQNNNHYDELSLSLAIPGFQESKRWATTLPPTSLSNQFEAEAQAHAKGKELRVSEECDKYEEAPRYLDPSCSNYTDPEQTVVASSSQLIPRNNNHADEEVERLDTNQFEARAEEHDNQDEQTREDHNAMDQKEKVADTYAAQEQSVAACLAFSEHVAASSSQLSPQISNPMHEVSPFSIEGEAQTLLASTTLPNNHIQERVQFLDKPRKEDLICKNGELVNEDQVCDNGTNLGKEMELCGSATEQLKGCEIGEEVTGEGKDVDIGDKATKPVKLASTCGQVQEQTIAASQASLDVGTCLSNYQPKDIQELNVTKHFIPLMSKVLDILQNHPVRTMSARHVQFMEEASRDLSAMNFSMEWLYPFIDKAKKCLSVVERAAVIYEVEMKIAEVEAQLQALKESKRSLEEENKITALSMDLDKPLYED